MTARSNLCPRSATASVTGSSSRREWGSSAARSALGLAGRAVRGARALSREAAGQLPRLARLERIEANTRVSLGLLVEERRRRAPRDVFFLYDDRAYDAADVGERIDNVVRGLLSIGVRQGEHVGVLMSARPSALAAVAAINRIGAVAVLMRPDGDPREKPRSDRSSGSSPTPSAPSWPRSSRASRRSCSAAAARRGTWGSPAQPTWSRSTRTR